jgi:DNA invertase Pin-like site-specific DNA recombinase
VRDSMKTDQINQKYGYARVSSNSQNLAAQLLQLKENGINSSNIFQEKVSGRKKDNRDKFNKLLETVKAGDTIVVTKLDRFARSTKDAINTIEMLNEKSVSLIILNLGGQTVDTTSSYGKFMITVLSGVAELEADINKERQAEGIALAKKRGVYRGRPKKYTSRNTKLQHALELFYERENNGKTVNQIADITGVSRATLYRAAKEQDVNNITGL